MSTRGILAWLALVPGLPTAADYGLIPTSWPRLASSR
jgi:hypothetical protein